MHSKRLLGSIATATLIAGSVVIAQNGTPINPNSKNVLTLAVYGDSPYRDLAHGYLADRQDTGVHRFDQQGSEGRSGAPRG